MKSCREQSIGLLLTEICKLRRNRSNALLADTGLHAGQDSLLYHLGQEDGQTVSALVEKICIQHATIFNMIDRMEASGMIRKEKDGADRRISRVYLTEQGRKALGSIGVIWKTLEAETTKGLSATQESQLRTLLQAVLKNLE